MSVFVGHVVWRVHWTAQPPPDPKPPRPCWNAASLKPGCMKSAGPPPAATTRYR